MANYESINKLLNKGERILDEIAREAVSLEHKPDKDMLRKIVQAISLVTEVQNSIWEADPELAVHYEGKSKKETKYMNAFRKLLKTAKEREECNDIPGAISELKVALDMEPPTIMYEVVVKEISRLRNENS